jgi:tRNA threonylcarbamoyladenosine biosynthesis protein TsaE
MDVYRLTGSAELDEMGYEEYLHGGGVMVIEWAEKIRDAIPDKAMYLECSYLDDNTREIKISGCSGRIRTWKKNLKEGG